MVPAAAPKANKLARLSYARRQTYINEFRVSMVSIPISDNALSKQVLNHVGTIYLVQHFIQQLLRMFHGYRTNRGLHRKILEALIESSS